MVTPPNFDTLNVSTFTNVLNFRYVASARGKAPLAAQESVPPNAPKHVDNSRVAVAKNKTPTCYDNNSNNYKGIKPPRPGREKAAGRRAAGRLLTILVLIALFLVILVLLVLLPLRVVGIIRAVALARPPSPPRP